MKLFEMIDVNYGIKAGHPGAMFTIGDVYGKQNLNVPHAKLNVQNKNKKKMGIPESIDPTDQAQFINALRDLLPIAMAQLEIEKLPKIKLEKYVEAAEQPTFGRFVNDTVTIHIGIENRHIIDILRTLAHELVHFKQHELGELGPESGRTGSTEENEAHAVAGVIMRNFNLKHPEYFHDPAISLDEAAKVRLSTDPSNFGAYVSDTGSHEEKTVKIPVHKIDVFEPDAKFDEPKYAKNLKKIVNAIKAGKTLPPILVRRMPGLRYQVLDGHHRFKAYRLAGVKSIPARIVAPANVKVDENLRDWFGKEKWVRMDTKGNIKGDCARGSEKEGKPKCLPQAKAHALGKKGRASAAQKKRREDPNPDRKGAAINVATKVREETVDEACWKGYHKDGMKTMFGKRYPNCVKNKNESLEVYVNKGECPGCGGIMVSEDQMNEKKDACYHKVKSRYKVWPSAYASGALVQCRKKGASNWGKNLSEEMLTEEMLREAFLDSVTKFLGNAIKEPVTNVSNLAGSLQVLYQVISDPKKLDTITFLLKKKLKGIIKALPPLAAKVKQFIVSMFPQGRTLADFFKALLLVAVGNSVAIIAAKVKDTAQGAAQGAAQDTVLGPILQMLPSIPDLVGTLVTQGAGALSSVLQALKIGNSLWFSLLNEINKKVQAAPQIAATPAAAPVAPATPAAPAAAPVAPVAENTTAAGINRALGGFFDPVVANLQRVALLAMQGRQSEAASRLNTAIKTASPDAQKRIIDAVNNIKPVTINGKVADSSTLEKSKEHNEWIIKTFIPWVKSQLEKNDTNEATNGPESKPTMPAGTVRVDVSDVYDWYKLGQHVSNMKGLGTHDFGKGPPSTIISFGSEEAEHKYINDLKKLGLATTDIDPKDLKQPKGMKKQKVDPTYNVNEDDSDEEIHNYEKLDNILAKLCKMVTDGQESDKDYGMVAAAVLDPDNRIVSRLNRPGKNGKRIHAEHAAIIGYTKQHGDIPEGSIIITTLSPCNEPMDERDGPSCTDLINRTVVKKVYCGYMDPTQTSDTRQFNLMETADRRIRRQCKKFADTFLDHVHENFADGKNPQDKGDSKRYGVPTKASISTLRKFAKKHSGRAAQLAHWAANMKSGKRK